MNKHILYLTATLGATSILPVSAQTSEQQQYEAACESGNSQACRELILYAGPHCDRGNQQACNYILRVDDLMQDAQIRRGYPQGSYDSSGLGQVPHVKNLLGDINGRGPGGAGYTNDAARGIFDGTLSPLDAARGAMGMGR